MRVSDQALFVSSVLDCSSSTREKRHRSDEAQRRYEQALLGVRTASPAKRDGAAAILEIGSTRELLTHVEQLCLQLRAVDPCASTGPADATTAERALLLCAPQQSYELQSSAEMSARSGHRGGTQAPRIAALLQVRLGQVAERHQRAMAMLERLPALLAQLAPSRDPVVAECRRMPPQLAMLLLADAGVQRGLTERLLAGADIDGAGAVSGAAPGAAPTRPRSAPAMRPRSASGGGAGRRGGARAARALLALLRAWEADGLGLLVAPPPRVHSGELAALPAHAREALGSAAAAAVGLCQAAHWARGDDGVPGLRQPPRGREQLQAEAGGEAPHAAGRGAAAKPLAAAAAWDHEAWYEGPGGGGGGGGGVPAQRACGRAGAGAAAGGGTHGGADGGAPPFAALLLRLARRLLVPAALVELRQAVAAALAAAPPEAVESAEAAPAEPALLQLALLVAAQAYLALVAQALAAALVARLERARGAGGARPPLPAPELGALRRAASGALPAVACVAQLLARPALLRRVGAGAADGEARLLAARCEWACQLACATELPRGALPASLGLAALRAALAAARTAQPRPVAVLAMSCQAAALTAMRARPLPPPPEHTPLRSPEAAAAAAAADDAGGGGGGVGGGGGGGGPRGARKALAPTTPPCAASASASAAAVARRASPAAAPGTGSGWRQCEARQRSLGLPSHPLAGTGEPAAAAAGASAAALPLAMSPAVERVLQQQRRRPASAGATRQPRATPPRAAAGACDVVWIGPDPAAHAPRRPCGGSAQSTHGILRRPASMVGLRLRPSSPA